MCTPAGHIGASRALNSTSLPCKGRLHQQILLTPPLNSCYSPASSNPLSKTFIRLATSYMHGGLNNLVSICKYYYNVCQHSLKVRSNISKQTLASLQATAA